MRERKGKTGKNGKKRKEKKKVPTIFTPWGAQL